ncbi:BTAD domain-containing putative transcriptional regulator [Actinoplanes sp. NPDC049596]|uniref:AfsR/SARP family transcriptional regulator n=1 Tax=unclassified Actinoplanes TaxID=2626549 RepID=UPI003433666F
MAPSSMSAEAPAVHFEILGPVSVRRGPEELVVAPAPRRAMLALLLARAGKAVTVAELIDLLWGQSPPVHAANLLHRHIGALRRQWEPELPNRSAGRWLLRQGDGYRMAVDRDTLDLLRFRDLVRRARTQDPPTALAMLADAVSFRRGAAGTNLDPGPRSHRSLGAIEREYGAVVDEFAALALGQGRAEAALPVVLAVAADHPHDERAQIRALRMLAACGRPAEAVARYDDIRRYLHDHLGVAPGSALRTAYATVLRQEIAGPTGSSATVAADPGDSAEPGNADPVLRPAQLPPRSPFYAGRDRLLEPVMRAVTADPDARIIALDGMPGIGKTTSAVHLAHDLAPDYPDGQLYLDLQGFGDEEPVTVEEALRDLISGLTDAPVPSTRREMKQLYAKVTNGRRVLIVLDNVRASDQLSDLLPGSFGCLTIVTSRCPLTDLRAGRGTHWSSLGLLTRAESRSCLVRHIGAHRAAEDPAALEAVIDRCGRLPLALTVVGIRAASFTGLPLSEVERELREVGESLDVLNGGIEHGGVRAVFESSYRLLSPPAARFFRFLSTVPGDELTSAAAGPEIGNRSAESLIAELLRTGLVQRRRSGRIGWHGLVKTYARELSTPAGSETGDRWR